MKPIEKEFSQGVKILLERMENNPEDFVGTGNGYPKFGMFADLMRDVIRGNRVKDWDDWYLFTKAEQSALVEGYKKMMRARFDQGVMMRLLEEPEDAGIKLKSRSHPSNSPLTPADITRHALGVLEKEFSKKIDKGVLESATATPTKLMLNPTQMKLAQKLGMSPIDYAIKTMKPPQK